jgi:hypothetical protein
MFEKFDRGYLKKVDYPGEQYRIVRQSHRPNIDLYTFEQI